MSRVVTLAGYAVAAAAMALHQLAARRARRRQERPRPATFVEWLDLVLRWAPSRWLLLAGWLWLGWHLFVRVSRP